MTILTKQYISSFSFFVQIPGCNSAKKLIFFKKKVATVSLDITVRLIP